MRRVLLGYVLLALCPCVPLLAQEPVRTAAATLEGPPTAAEIQARIDAIKADASIAEELRTPLLEVLSTSLALTREGDTFDAQAKTFTTEKEAAPDLLRTTRDELSRFTTPGPPRKPPNATARDLEQRLAEAQQEQQNTAKEIADLEKEATRRTERRSLIPARLVEARKALDALPEKLPDENALDARLMAARRWRLQAERRKLDREITALAAEQGSYEARDELLTVRRDLAARRSHVARTAAEAWQAILQESRTAEAAATEAAAQQAAAQAARDAHPLVAKLAQENAEIATELPGLASARQQIDKDQSEAKDLQQKHSADFEDVKRRVKRAGSTQTIGSLLRQRRAQLPDASRLFRRHTRDYESLLAQAHLAALDSEDRRRALTDDPDLLDRLIAGAEPPLTDSFTRQQIRARARELLDARLEMLRTLRDGWSNYLGNLEELDATQHAIQELVDEYRTFINERVLWIRSSSPIWRLDLEAAGEAGLWTTAPQPWFEAWVALWSSFTSEAWPFALLALVLIVLGLRPMLRKRLRQHGDTAARGNNTRYRPTALALLDTFLLAAPLPALLWLMGWRLEQSTDCTEFGKAIAAGALSSASFLAVVRGLREIVRAGGLAEIHFQWHANTLRLFRRNLILLVPAAFPLATALGALEYRGKDEWLGSLGRLLLLPLLALVMVFLWRTLHPTTGVLSGSGNRTVLGRSRRLWFVLGVGTPAVLLGLAVLGYEYTALQLVRRLIYTVALVLAGALVHALIVRKLLLERRRLTIEQARERIRAAKAAATGGAQAAGDTADEEEEETVRLDPSSIAKQTQALLRATVVLVVLFLSWQIWVDVLPALGVFRQVPLWMDNSVEPNIEITLADLLMSLVILLVTTLAARNLPGLLELLVLQRLRIQAGERHAITTLARYVLVAIGVVMAFSTIGLGWSKVQWLIAAVSLGLGFGLQEIFANFVSGLILLFERPVRVGDIVVVGDVLGKVTRIKIRATTIRDLDNKELVVPNKEFVTGRFVNWTLTDSLVRLRVAVGVAYGSDTEKARRLLVQAARECPYAAKSPNPKALFLGFGDSTLDLELRAYIEDYDEHADMLDDLHGRIDRLFRQNKVEIAFPQRDLHLRSASPVVEFMARREAQREGVEGAP